MVSTKLSKTPPHIPRYLPSSKSHVGMSEPAVTRVKPAGWWLLVLFGPETAKMVLVPRWLILFFLWTALCCFRRSSPHFGGRKALLSSISHHCRFFKLQQKRKNRQKLLSPFSTASFSQGKATPSPMLAPLLQWPWSGTAAGWGGGWTAAGEGQRLWQMWLVESGFEKMWWTCGSVCELDVWGMSYRREWKTPFGGCPQLTACHPANATRFSFTYAVEKPWAGPRQVSVICVLSGSGSDARIANRIRKSGYAFFL